MKELGASERIVLKTLDELQRQGRIVRRQGAGTYVTERQSASSARIGWSQKQTASRTIVAIARPDKSIFDRCMELLYAKSCTSDIDVTCRLLGPEQISSIQPESLGDALGYIVFRRDLAPLAKRLHDAGKRVVLVGAPGPDQVFGVPCVCGNQEHGGYLVTKRLIELGHRNILFTNFDGVLLDQARWQGNLRALAEAKRNGFDVRYSFANGDDVGRWTSDPVVVRDLVGCADGPTAIAAWNDREAVSVVNALSRAGVRVPTDVSVIGYDNLDEGARMHPSLSTVDHLIELQVNAAIDLLTRPNAPDASRTIVFTPTIVERETTAPPAHK
jgi:hypothetical protein